MTDTMPETAAPEAPAEQGWGEDSSVTYPERPDNPHNHRYTISMDGRGPMVVVRGNTAEEVNAAWQELEAHATGAIMGNAWAAIRAAAMVANGLGASPAPAAPQGPPAPPVMGPGPAFNPPPAVPGVPGQAPAAWQNAGAPAAPPAPPQGQWGNQAPQGPSPEYAQAGWYRLTVPFPKKGEFDGLCAQYQMRKGRPSEGGSFSFQKADKSWYVSPQFAGGFGQFNPVPA